MDENVGKNISKNLSDNYSQKPLYYAKQSVTDALKTTSKKVIQKTAESTGDLTVNKIANRIMEVSRRSLQNNSETITNEHDKEIPKERYICPEERQKIRDELRLMQQHNIIIEYQKIINLLDDTPNQPSKFKTKNWVKINDKSGGSYNEDNQIRFKTSMLRSSLCNDSYAYILVKGTITVTNTAAQGAANNAANKKVIFKNLAPFTNCIDSINNTQIDDGHDIDVVITNV